MPDTLAGRTPQVLVIENDPDARTSLRRALEPGFVVAEAVDGVSGVEAALAGAPDLVLVDAALPDIDGYEVATRLRGRGLTAPIIALTSAGSHDRGLSLSAGCDGSVEKPVDGARLPEQLRQFLAGKKEKLKTGEERRYLREYAQGLVEKLEGKVKELTRANERLTVIDRFKTEFMQSVSHELSTPLTPIVGYLKILKSKKLGELNERQEKVVDAMLQSTDRLSRVLDNLVDFAGLETGRYHIRKAPLEPVALAHGCVAESIGQAKGRRVSIVVSDLSGARTLDGDEGRLKQALGNLVDNAVKFSPNGGSVLVELSAGDEGLTISVYDQGPGVPAEERERIFDPFFHASRAGEAEKAPGAGLGLPVTRKIAEAHGGKAWLESPPREQPRKGEHRFHGARAAIFLPWKAT